MQERPTGVVLFVIWSCIAGVVITLYGLGIFVEGTRGLGAAWGDPPDELALKFWVPYFKTYVAVGLIWIAGGVCYCISAIVLLNGVEWGRRVTIISIIAISIGWIIIKFVSLSFALPLPLIGIIIAVPMLYLWTREVREYCANPSLAPIDPDS